MTTKPTAAQINLLNRLLASGGKFPGGGRLLNGQFNSLARKGLIEIRAIGAVPGRHGGEMHYFVTAAGCLAVNAANR